MATDLTGLFVADTYQSLLKIGDNSSLTGDPDRISDGFGNNSNLYLTTTQVSIGVVPASGYDLTVNGAVKAGSLYVVGNTTSNAFIKIGGTSSQFLKADGSVDSSVYLTSVSAAIVSYDNTQSGLVATNVNSAIDELQAKKVNITDLAANVVFYPTTAESGITNYFLLVDDVEDPNYNSTAVDIETPEITGDNQLIALLASAQGQLIGNTGTLNVHTIGNIRRSSGFLSGRATFYYQVFKRASNGTETLLSTSSTTQEVTSNTYEEFYSDALIQNATFTETDRVVLKFYGNQIFGSAQYEIQFGGASPVRSLFPVPITVIPSDTAEDIIVDTSNFNTLNGDDDNVQHALETIDAELTAIDLDYVTEKGSVTENDITVGDINAGNITLTGYIRGAANLVIDPAAYGDETGTVQILGDLRVDGTTTTINSTTVTVADKNIVLAEGSALPGDANGAGITIDGADATMTYNSTSDRFVFNKDIETDLVGNVTGDLTGNADTASALETARNIALDGDVSGNADFDGSGDITITTVVANDSHTHDGRYYTETESDARFVNVTGDTMTGNLNFSETGEGITWAMNTDGASIKFYNTGNSDTDSRLEFQTTDDNNEYFRWTIKPFGTDVYELMRLTGNGTGGTLDIAGSIQVNDITVIDSNRNLTAVAGTFSSDIEVDDKITIKGTTNDFVIEETTDGEWHLYDTFQDNGIILYSSSGGMEFQYQGTTEMVIDAGGVRIVGGIDLSDADLNIGSADVIFSIDATDTGARGFYWSFDADGDDIAGLIGYIRAGGTLVGEKMQFNMNAEGTITGSNAIYEFKNGGTDIVTIGADGGLASKYITLTNQELTLNPPAYSIWMDANDSNRPANLGDYAGSAPLGLYVNGDDGIASTTLGSGTVQVYHTGHFSGTNITNWESAYTYSQVGHLPLTGGTLTGNLRFNDDTEGIIFGSSPTNNGSIFFDATLDGVIMQQTQGTDWSRIRVGDINTNKFEVFGGNSTDSGEFDGTGWTSLFSIDSDGDVTVSGNINGNLIGNVTGSASLNVLKSGDTMTGSLTIEGAGYRQLLVDQTDSASITMGVSSASTEGFINVRTDGVNHINASPILKLIYQDQGATLSEYGRFTTSGLDLNGDIYLEDGQGIVSASGAKIVTGSGGGTFQSYAAASNNYAFIANNSSDVVQLGVDVGGQGWSYFAGDLAINQTTQPTHRLEVNGNTGIYGSLYLNSSDSLAFENGKHWITYNDGEGNFNFRVGNFVNSGGVEECTEAGYIFHDEWNQGGSWRQFNVSADSMAVGELIGTDSSWRTQIEYDTNSVYLRYQGNTRLTTASNGVYVDGGGVRINGTTNNLWITENTDGEWHIYDTFQDNGIKIYSSTGGMEFQYNGVTEMTIDGNGVVFTGTVDLSDADLNIGSADIVFAIDDTDTGARGLVWNFDGDGDGTASLYAYVRSGGTLVGEKMQFNTNGEETITGSGAIYEFKNAGSDVVTIGADGSVTADSFSGDGSNITNVDAETLDGLNSTQFLRSDADDTATGMITINTTGGGVLRLQNNDTSNAQNQTLGSIVWNNQDGSGTGANNAAIIEAQTYGTLGQGANLLFKTVLATTEGDDATTGMTLFGNGDLTVVGDVNATSFVGDGTNVTGVNATLLDGINGSEFLRSNANDTATGNITFDGLATFNASAIISGVGNALYLDRDASERNLIIFRDEGVEQWDLWLRDGGELDWVSDVNGLFKISSDLTVTGDLSVGGSVTSGLDLGGVLDMNDHDILDATSIRFTNQEGESFGTVSGTLMFDENFYADTEYGSTSIWDGNGGGLAIYNEDGWGRIISDANMEFLNAEFNSVTTGNISTSGAFTSQVTFNERVGIGTTSPDGKLHVLADTTNNQFILERIGTATGKYKFYTNNNSLWIYDEAQTAHRMMINSIGQVGIGTTSPTSKLNVAGGGVDIEGSSSVRIRFYNGTTFQSGMQAVLGAGEMISGSSVGDLAVRSQSNMLFATGGNSERMRIDASGDAVFYGDITTSGSGSNVIRWTNTGAAQSWITYVGSNDDFIIRDETDSRTVLQLQGNGDAIFPSGDVGIGTTSPANKLHVSSSSFEVMRLERPGVAGGGVSMRWVNGDNRYWNTYHGGDERFYFDFEGSTKFIIESGGNVGIGVTDPDRLLTIDNTSLATNNPALKVVNNNSSSSIIAQFVNDSDALNIKSIGSGDYQITNPQQDNAVDFYDGTGGVAIRYNDSIVLRAWSTGGVDVTGDMKASGDVVAYSSDERLKENVKPIEGALDKLMQIKGVTFDWKDEIDELGFEPRNRKNDVGVIAQDIEKVLPQLIAPAPFDTDIDEEGNRISKSGKDYVTVQYDRLNALLIEAIKEQQKQIDELKARLDGSTK